jgi:hypothetical protein
MVGIMFGSDVYGAVHRVRGTPIVTRFWMLYLLPVVPVESLYLRRLGQQTGLMIPFVGGATQTKVYGIRCARIDLLSVGIAYIRGIAGLAVLVGSVVTFGLLLSRMSGPPPDDFQRVAAIVGGAALALGLLIGGATYAFTFGVPSRDRRIREACARAFGIAIDPARVKADVAAQIDANVQIRLVGGSITVGVGMDQPIGGASDELDLQLARARAKIQLGAPQLVQEAETDRLLGEIAIRRGEN